MFKKDPTKVIGYIYKISYIEDFEYSPNLGQEVVYIGQHRVGSNDKLTESELIEDGYWGSGKIIKRHINLHFDDTSDLTKEILEYPIYGQDELDAAEQYWISWGLETYGKKLLNIEKGGRSDSTTYDPKHRFLKEKEKSN